MNLRFDYFDTFNGKAVFSSDSMCSLWWSNSVVPTHNPTQQTNRAELHPASVRGRVSQRELDSLPKPRAKKLVSVSKDSGRSQRTGGPVPGNPCSCRL